MTPKSPSTDIFDMVPFSPISPQSSTPTRNGTQPPPVPSRSTEISKFCNKWPTFCLHFFNKASLKFYVRFAWKAKHSFCKSHSVMPFHLYTIFPKSLMLLPSCIINKLAVKLWHIHLEGVGLGILTWLFFYSLSFCTSRNTFTSC